MSQEVPDNIFRFLIATDSHLGYNEKDPIRGKAFLLITIVYLWSLF